MGNKIQSFTGLTAWQEAHKLVLEVYTITNKFPKEEIFGLTNQMRRAVVSITSNIAEGFCRYSAKEKLRFYNISLGSLAEIQNQLLIAKDIKYIDKEIFDKIANYTIIISKLLNGLIKSCRNNNSLNT